MGKAKFISASQSRFGIWGIVNEAFISASQSEPTIVISARGGYHHPSLRAAVCVPCRACCVGLFAPVSSHSWVTTSNHGALGFLHALWTRQELRVGEGHHGGKRSPAKPARSCGGDVASTATTCSVSAAYPYMYDLAAVA